MRKRSKYRPRPIQQDPVSWVINGMRPVTDAADTVMVIHTANHGSLERIVLGKGTKDDVKTLSNAFITSRSLANHNVGEDWADELEAAGNALVAMGERGKRTGRYVFTGPELNAVNLGMAIHDLQYKNCTIATLEKAIAKAKDVIRSSPKRKECA